MTNKLKKKIILIFNLIFILYYCNKFRKMPNILNRSKLSTQCKKIQIVKIVRRKIINSNGMIKKRQSNINLTQISDNDNIIKRRLLKKVIRILKPKNNSKFNYLINDCNKNLTIKEFNLNNKTSPKKIYRVKIEKRIRKIKKNNLEFLDSSTKKFENAINSNNRDLSKNNELVENINLQLVKTKSHPDKRFSGLTIQQQKDNSKKNKNIKNLEIANDLIKNINKKYLNSMFLILFLK